MKGMQQPIECSILKRVDQALLNKEAKVRWSW